MKNLLRSGRVFYKPQAVVALPEGSTLELNNSRDEFEATESQTVFTTTFDISSVDNIHVYIDGLAIFTGYSVTGVTEVTFDNGLDEGTEVVIEQPYADVTVPIREA